jgi:hypothetical protein
MRRRLALCAVAALLAAGALISNSKPTYACTAFPACGDNSDCPVGKTCNICTGKCL